ncbi:uncharacterized protein LOC118194643 [Stegodyphus dumicola]|uniref:uncharacterized protein LOC118194643 n=1 Tax=Stegodyphus dumicola TaxID=202533 RepID=UPI0015ABDEF9|nr:uncharacterized protein LOC118194643 [Stegodyphus dumicola]
MALQQREICKVGESPTQDRRSLSPRRGVRAADDSPENPVIVRSPKMSPELLRSPSKVSPRQKIESPKNAAWKSSKFFSKSMASGELLKSLKKLSPSPSSSNTCNNESGVTTSDNKEADAKSFKSRFTSLRRKSGSDSDSVPNVDSESLELGSPEVRGIVCKKEDLMSLMSVPGATKERRVSSPAELIVPVCSNLPSSPLPVLKSPSLKVAPHSPLNTRGSFRSSRSTSLDPASLPRISPRPSSKSILQHHLVTDDIDVKPGTFLEVVPEVKRRLSGPLIQVKERIPEEDESETPVQWDDSNFVDPNLIGGAIEAYLKGMGPSPTPTPSTEKRVSFKKNLIK